MTRIRGIIKFSSQAVAALLVICWLVATAAHAADFVVITHKGVAGSLSREELQAVFLGEKTKWEDGKPIRIVTLEEGTAHKAFLKTIVGKTPSQFAGYWKKLVFTGKAAAPKAFDEASKLLEYVAGQSGAIGYVAPDQVNSSVKIFSIR